MEGAMPAITLKNIPTALYRRLKRQAVEHHRSLNREAILCLERSLGSARIDPEEFLARAASLRKRLRIPPLTDAFINEAKSFGRR
jgi:plasmid stability protein